MIISIIPSTINWPILILYARPTNWGQLPTKIMAMKYFIELEQV